MVGIKHESMRKEQTSHKNEHNTLMCFPLEPVFTRDKRRLPNFIDEPTLGLDIEARTEILDLLRDYLIEDENRSILITSHISSDLETLCDDIYLVHNGKLMLHEKIDVILEQYGILKVTKEQYETLDKEAILKIQKEAYGYACLTNDKNYYLENYPQIAVENSRIDALILMTTGGY